MDRRSFTSQVMGAALMVTGTCIGAGMLGLPVVTAAGGLVATTITMLVSWLIMTFTGLVMLEVALYFPRETNFISMATLTLGPWGGRIAWFTYIFFLYSLMAAYTSQGTTVLAKILHVQIDNPIELCLMTAAFVVPFAFFVYRGAKSVDWLNRLFIVGLVVCFFVFISNIHYDKYDDFNLSGAPKYLWIALPFLVTTLGFHLLVPTLKTYLRSDIPKLRLAIVIGSLIPLAIYWLWVFVVFQLVPVSGEHGLVAILSSGQNPGEVLIHLLSEGQSWKLLMVASFIFFALVSSFVGVGLGISDFLADGLHIPKSAKGRLLLAILTFAPPALFTFFNPRGFLFALGYAGIFAAILLIIYPVLMAWSGRYVQQSHESPYRVMGGRLALLLALGFGLVVIIVEALDKLSLLPIPSI